MRTFTRKGYGRIYVQNYEAINVVKEMVEDMDAFEYDYLPDDFITLFEEYPKLVFTHKFCDLDIDELTARCWDKGVPIFCFDNGERECFASL
ncbi:MAG: hypothetical protein GY718_10015 [Lentisphaerae bacterium]|nr:hypothetical protein [Lentisphaerota bacterium]